MPDADADDGKHRKKRKKPSSKRKTFYFPVLFDTTMDLEAAWEAVSDLLRRLSTALAVGV